MGSHLIIPYSGAAAADVPVMPELWLTAEQDAATGDGRLSWQELSRMLALGRTGASATSSLVAGCPVTVAGQEVSITVRLNVYPSSPIMHYRLQPAYGELQPGRRDISKEVEVLLLYDMAATAEAGRVVLSADSLAVEWLSPVFDQGLSPVDPPPAISHNGGTFSLPAPHFGIGSAAGLQHGYQHDIVMRYARVAGQRYTDIKNSVLVSWTDERSQVQSLTVDLEIPVCLEQILAYCPGGGLNLRQKEADVTRVHAYVSECSGMLITTVVIPPPGSAHG